MEGIKYRAYKFRLMPTCDQKVLLNKHFGCIRFVYNHFLKEKQDHYLHNSKTLNHTNYSFALTNLKKQDDCSWLNEVSAQALQQSLIHLEGAYGNFFRHKSKFPRFKSKHSNNSFTSPQWTTIRNGKLHIPKFKEGIKITIHRPIKGTIKSATISKSPAGKYYASILCEIEAPEHFPKTNKSIGLDLGIIDFVVTSSGDKIANPKYLKTYERKLKHKQQIHSRKQVGSKRREKSRLKVARLHDKIANCRNDFQHKLSLDLIKKYDTIGVETLGVKKMMSDSYLAKSIGDASWFSFISKLEYKADWYGKKLIKIDQFYPSSKTCSCCGFIKEDLTLSNRDWSCPKCDTTHDRDINAAQNILTKSKSILSSGIDDYRHQASGKVSKKSSPKGE